MLIAYIHTCRDKDGDIKNYRLVVSDGLNRKGQQRRCYSTWTPPNPNMREKQMKKQAMAAVIKFEEDRKAGALVRIWPYGSDYHDFKRCRYGFYCRTGPRKHILSSTFLYLSVVYATPVGYNDTIPDLTAKVIGKRIVCLTIAPASTFVELYTKHGLDTITVPIAASLILSAAALIL